MHPNSIRQLMSRQQVIAALNVSDTDVQWLIETRQLATIRIREHERFDSKDVWQLVETYKLTQNRRKQ